MTTSIIADAQRTVTPLWPVPEERRIVTVLFADIVGSTALVNRLDPEDVRAMQRAYFDTVAGVLHRWQGVVEKYIGDAVMALFGARRSDGFDAYRAVRAGLEIQAALDRRPMVDDIRLRVRVGVATGEVVVDLGDAVTGGHGAASGAVITTAARLQEYAAPGAVALCAATARATAGLIAKRQLAPVTGQVPPAPLWHAVGPVRPGAERHDGPLVGRRRELATVRDQLGSAIRDRAPRWVSLVGPTGSGRSRLLHELTRGLATVDGSPVRWCVAPCQPCPDQALAPVAYLLRDVAGIRHGDGPAAVHDRLVAALTPLLAPTRVATAVSALHRMLTSPDGSAAALAGAAVGREVLLSLAAHRPLIVAVDDLDRAAPAVRRFLHALFGAATERGLPLALLTVHQPQCADTRPDPARPVTIGPLATVQSGRLLRHLLARAGQPVALVDRLLPLVGGRPGHAAAYVTSVVDGADPAALPLPEVVRRAVGPELDHLDGERRAVLMAAGTLDDPICGEAVDRALGWTPGRAAPVLRGLVAAGLLLPHRVDGYAFAAPALRQVAAERLPRALRVVFKRRAAGLAHLDTADLADDPAGLVNASTADAEIVRLDTVGARSGHLDAVFAALTPVGPDGATDPNPPRRGNPTPTMAARPAVANPGTDRTVGGGSPRDTGRLAASARATRTGAAGNWRLVDVDAAPGTSRSTPGPPLTRRPDGLPASA
ncbi:adenylate/guanylate cyclase domain-containing protein [Micromonospora sp. NPDC048835]|uniref:adenylate/guanylate cyclase domain-containing protein n=1 Tax=Micromonospora sp. NPDC048835 TaxID=3155147 RepID=UPI0033D16C7A